MADQNTTINNRLDKPGQGRGYFENPIIFNPETFETVNSSFQNKVLALDNNGVLSLVNGGGTTVSASYASTASYALTAATASYFSGSISNAISASYALTASFAQNLNPSATASYAISASRAISSSQAVSSSYALSASYAAFATSASQAISASYAFRSISASFADNANNTISASRAVSSSQTVSASYALNTTSASFALTASYVNPLNQSVTIGSVISIPSPENTLNIYPSLAGGIGEGGQILLAASEGIYTSASMLDTWQDQFRILRGSNTGGSNASLMNMNLQTGNTQFTGAVTASAYSGLPNSWLYALRNSNQTIGSGTWANRDIIFNEYSSNNFTYNSTTGIATLRAGKTYRITSRVAWSAAAVYTFQIRVYSQTASTFVGPTAEMVQATNGTNNISDGTLEHIVAVGGSDIDISIRTTVATNALSGEYIRSDLNTQLIIQQIA